MKRKVKITPSAKDIKFAKSNLFTFFRHENMEEIQDGIFFYNIPVDDYMHSRNMLCAAALKVRFTSICGNPIIYNTIIHDSGFDKLPKYVQQFFIAHEIGHIMNGDLDNIADEAIRSLNAKRLFGFLPTIEICADSYAASIVGYGNAKEAIKWMIKNTDIPLISKIELFRRSKRIPSK